MVKNWHLPVPCGGCLKCLINKRRIWAARCMLELRSHPFASFVTLTLADENLPAAGYDHCGVWRAPLSVQYSHHDKFCKDLRYHYGKPFRYYMVGEYGEKTGRPHYHYILFGYSPCERLVQNRAAGVFKPCPCRPCQLLSDVWKLGHIFNGSVTVDSCNYVAGYVTKKLTSDKCARARAKLAGRHPEFSYMSRRPGIGAFQAIEYGQKIRKWEHSPRFEFPKYLNFGNKTYPIGRFLNEKILSQLDTAEEIRARSAREYEDKLLDLSLDALNRTQFFHEEVLTGVKTVSSNSLAIALELANTQYSLNVESKFRLKKHATI